MQPAQIRRKARIFGCSGPLAKIKCEAIETKFNLKQTTGHTQLMSTVNLTKVKPIEGVFGDSLKIYGSKQQFFTVLNRSYINPHVFSVSFWIKQDHGNFVNSSVISHVNSSKTAGWYVQSNTKNLDSNIQFSVANSNSNLSNVGSYSNAAHGSMRNWLIYAQAEQCS